MKKKAYSLLFLFILFYSLPIGAYSDNLADNSKSNQSASTVASQTSAIRPLTIIRQMAKLQPIGELKPFSAHWFQDKAIINVDFSKEPGLAYSLIIGDKTKF